MAAAGTSQLTFTAICWSKNTVAQWFPTAVSRELNVPQRRFANWIR